MTFLQSGLLWSLAPFLAAPLIIHLLSRRLTKPLRFPSVQHLKVSITRSASIYRWRHWLFILLRTLVLLLLLLAFLMPVLMRESSADVAQSRTVFIVIDNSISMEHSSGGKQARQRAISEAERIIDTLRPGDRINIIRAHDDTATALPTPSESATRVRAFLKELPAGNGRANITQANHQIAGMAFKGQSSSTEVYYLSDFQRADWANVDFRPLPESARVFFVDVGAKNRDNRALSSITLEGERVAGGMVTIEVSLANFADTDTEETIELRLDGRPIASSLLYAAPNSIAKTKLPIALPEEGTHLIEARIAEDSLPLDDTIYAVIEVSEKQEVLLLSGEEESVGPGVDYLEAALNPFIGSEGAIRPRRLNIEEVSPADFAAVNKVFLSQTGPMDEITAKRLADFLFSGGGVVWFLDGPNDAESLSKLAPLIGDEGLSLQLGPWNETESLANARQVISGDFRSPFLKLFTGTRLQDLGRLEVYDNYSAAFSGQGKKLLSFDDGSPAMTEQTHGMGQLILVNISPDTQFSNLAKQRFFPVWIQALVHAFGTEQVRPLYLTTGSRAVTNLWKNDISQRQFRAPDGTILETQIEVIGQRANVSFTVRQLGVYQLTDGDKLISAFAVNPPQEEADLRSIPMEDLPERDGAPEQAQLLEGTTTDFNKAVFGHPLFPWFIGAALLCLLAELGLHELVHRNRPVARTK